MILSCINKVTTLNTERGIFITLLISQLAENPNVIPRGKQENEWYNLDVNCHNFKIVY